MKFDHELDWFYKYPKDTFTVEYDFNNDLSGDTLNTCTATIFDSGGTDKTASMISNTSVTSPDVTFDIADGQSGETYSIKLVAVSSGSKKYTQYLTCDVVGTISLNTKLGDKSANSYVTLKEANDYIRNKYGHDSKWDTLSPEGRKRVLIEAAKMLNRFNYIDDKYYDSQSLIFPFSSHDIITGNCATPITTTSFKNTSLKSDTYNKYPTDYWKYSTVHITAATPIYEVRNITKSNVTTGSVTISPAFSNAPTTNTTFIIFTPLFDEVKNAQIEQALFIVENSNIGTLQTYGNIGVEEVEIGDTRVEFGKGSKDKIAISSISKKLISRWLRKHRRIGRA